MARLAELLPAMRDRAGAHDQDASFPAADMDGLREAGLLTAPLPERFGGLGVGTAPAGAATLARDILLLLGAANLAIARLWEAHVNALRLAFCYGELSAALSVASDVAAGALFGLWVADVAGSPPLGAQGDRLVGRKGLCSGAGHCARALVTVQTAHGTRMAIAGLTGREAVAPVEGLHGLRAACQGVVDLGGTPILAWVGAPGDYLREPDFSCGAWRGSAAASGALDAIVDAVRVALVGSDRGAAPPQLARFGELRIAQDTARLFVDRACHAAEMPGQDPDDQVATVSLARIAVERACLEGIERAQHALGPAEFVAPHPLERLARDLATYLRPPAPDEVLLKAAEHALRQSA